MIKRITLSILALLALATTVNAQTRSRFEEEISVGVQGGLNLSQVRFMHNDVTYASNLGDLGYRKGASFGASVRFIAQKHFGIQLEANYQQCGWSEKWDDQTVINDQEFKGLTIKEELDYINIPLLAHIYFGDKNRLFFNMGPRMGFMINRGDRSGSIDEAHEQALAENNANDPRINDSISANKFDYGLCVGAGYEFRLKKLSILAEARWNYGLKDVFEHDRTAVFQRSNNQAFTFTLGVMMPVVKFHSK